jgi:hypothetical protein
VELFQQIISAFVSVFYKYVVLNQGSQTQIDLGTALDGKLGFTGRIKKGKNI